MGNKTPSLGAHSGSLNKTLVARTRKLGASGDRAPVRQQPCSGFYSYCSCQQWQELLMQYMNYILLFSLAKYICTRTDTKFFNHDLNWPSSFEIDNDILKISKRC